MIMELTDFFEQNRRVAIAFSGGVDSAYLLFMATKCGADVAAFYVKSQFQPQFEYEDACKLANDLGVKLYTIELDILQCENVVSNPDNRCYFCKRKIFEAIIQGAHEAGYTVIADGTNASDDADDRPGMKVLRELSVCSPLRMCGLTKAMIRKCSREAGLFTWNKPAYACLATRVKTGEIITEKKLRITEAAEQYLFEQGFRDFRVRMRGTKAVLMFTSQDKERFYKYETQITNRLLEDYSAVIVDSEVRNSWI